MAQLTELTIAQWIGSVGLIFFAGVLIWSLVRWNKSPPTDRERSI